MLLWASLSVGCRWQKLRFLGERWSFGLIYYIPVFQNRLQRRAGCESAPSFRKSSGSENLISAFSLGETGFLLELQRYPFLGHKKTLAQDFLLFLMYFKG